MSKLPPLKLTPGRYSHTRNDGIEVYHADFYSRADVAKFIAAALKMERELNRVKRN